MEKKIPKQQLLPYLLVSCVVEKSTFNFYNNNNCYYYYTQAVQSWDVFCHHVA